MEQATKANKHYLLTTIFIVSCCVCGSAQMVETTRQEGYIVGWGKNIGGQATGIPSYPFTNGQLDITGNPFSTGTVVVAEQIIADAIQVSPGRLHTLALRENGTIVGWGNNGRGEVLGRPTEYPGRTNGTVRISGQILTNVIDIATGEGFSLALKRDGTVIGWGSNAVSIDIEDYVAIAAAAYVGAGLKSDGAVAEWVCDPSWPRHGQPRNIRGLSNVTSIEVSAGYENIARLALLSDGTVRTWGDKDNREHFAPPKGLSNVTAVASGGSHSLALKRDGTVFGWGFNKVGQATGVPTPGLSAGSSGQVTLDGEPLRDAVAIEAASGYSMALKNDGTVVAWGRMINNRFPATVPEGLTDVVAIAAADSFSLAITTNKAVADRFRISQKQEDGDGQ